MTLGTHTRIVPGCYAYGRRCPEPGCITTLCIWNPGPLCYWHTAEQKKADRAHLTLRPDQQAEQEEREMEELLRTPPMPGLASAA